MTGYYSHDDDIRLLGIGLAMDETAPNAKCPRCNGGYTRENSFSVTRVQGGLIYNCFRATCDYAGFVSDKAPVEEKRSTPKGKPHIKPNKIQKEREMRESKNKAGGNKRKLNPFRGETLNLTADQQALFTTMFSLTSQEVERSGLRWCPTTASYIVPIWNGAGNKVGSIDRSWTGRSPKAINHWSVHCPNLYFPKDFKLSADKIEPIIIVEDWISAIKVNRHKPCVAALGTNIGSPEAAVLRGFTNRILFALDPDANKKALKLASKYKLVFDYCGVMLLDKDPKDMSNGALKATFGRAL